MNHRRIALVPPRYGDDVVGGAETLLRHTAYGLAERGWNVDVLSTCAKDHFTWANFYPAGETTESTPRGAKLRLLRFPMVKDTSGETRARVEQALAGGVDVSLADQEAWMNDSPRSPELFHYLLDHASEYVAIMVAPYLFWTSFATASVAPDKTLLVPCLHDEPYARLEIFEPMLTGSAAVWLQTEPELDVYRDICTPPAQTRIVGEGVDLPDHYDEAGFRETYGLGNRRFVLYGGRREGAKGWEGLLASFSEAVRTGVDLSMVTFGVGDVVPADDMTDQVFDLGFVDDTTRDNAMAAASAYIQPSGLESFSRTIMEAWLAGTPVVANAASAVVSWHIERSNAGLTYRDEDELQQCLRFIAEAPEQAEKLASSGRQYVLDNYTWPKALDRMEATLAEWFQA